MKKTIILLAVFILTATSLKAQSQFTGSASDQETICQNFWDGWFFQAGLDMTLLHPYKKSFTQSFSKGRTHGISVALGKWFSPEIGLRAQMDWENGFPLFKNNKLEWMPVADDGSTNMDKGGCLNPFVDVMFNLTNLFDKSNTDRKWNVYIFPRAGFSYNLENAGLSPIVGAGGGANYRLNERLCLFGDLAFNMTTSDFFSGIASTGMEVSTSFNSFYNLRLGVQINL